MKRLTIAIALAIAVTSLFGEDISAPGAAGGGEPFLFAAKDSLLLSWIEPSGPNGEAAVRLARHRAGRWSEARTIVKGRDLVVNPADFPSVVEDANGTLFAQWLQSKGGEASDIHIAISKNDGRTWSAPMLLNRDGKRSEHGFVTLAPLTNGGVAVAWLDGRNMVEGKEEGDMSLRYATIDAGGVVRGETQLDSRTCECCATGMAIANGAPVVVYRDRSSDEVRDIASVRASGAKWSQPRIVHHDGWKIAGCPVNGPQVDARGDRVATAWFTAAGGKPHVYAAFSDDAGATFGEPIVVDDGNPIGRVDVVMLDRDRAVVTWLEHGAAGADVRARMVSRNRQVAASVKLGESPSPRSAGVPRAAIVGSDVYVAWTDVDRDLKRLRIAHLRF